jgi:hypothetical protein
MKENPPFKYIVFIEAERSRTSSPMMLHIMNSSMQKLCKCDHQGLRNYVATATGLGRRQKKY